MLNLGPCTTPAYSPESNGMAEAFVKTFKRDYVWSADLSSAVAVMWQLEACTVTVDILELSQDHWPVPFCRSVRFKSRFAR